MKLARLCLLTCLMAVPFSASADTAFDAAPSGATIEQPELKTDISVAIVRPALEADGTPVLDKDGLPTFTFIPVEDTTILPGDEIRYSVNMQMAGGDASNLELAFDIPAETKLLPATISSDRVAAFAVGDGQSPETRTPVFDDAGAVSEAYTALEDGAQRRLFATFDLPSGEAAIITYNAIIR